MFRLLIVDDDKVLQSLLADSLGQKYQVSVVSSLADAREMLQRKRFDLILLDVGLPDGDGFKFCASLRNSDSTRDIPIIFFTGNVDVQDKVMGFSLGADDYVTKPFHLEELRVRIEARLKRMQQQRDRQQQLAVGNLHIDLDFQRVTLVESGNEVLIDTTPLEFRLLYVMAKYEGKVFTREQLIESVWGKDFHISERAVDTHLSNLRKKIAASSCVIKSIHGVGYKLALAENAAVTTSI